MGGVNYFFGISAFLMSYFTLKGIIEEYPDISYKLATFIFLMTNFTNGLNGIRQYVAASICFLSLKYVYRKKIISFILMIIFASTMHITAICFLPIYIFWDETKKDLIFNKKVITGLVGAFFVVLYYKQFLLLIGGRFANYSSDIVNSRNLTFYLMLTWFVIFLCLYKKITQKNNKYKLLIVMYFIGLLCQYLGFISPAVARIGIYFNYPSFLLIAKIPDLFSNKYKKIIVCFLILYIILSFVFIYGIAKQSNIIPYRTKIITNKILNNEFK